MRSRPSRASPGYLPGPSARSNYQALSASGSEQDDSGSREGYGRGGVTSSDEAIRIERVVPASLPRPWFATVHQMPRYALHLTRLIFRVLINSRNNCRASWWSTTDGLSGLMINSADIYISLILGSRNVNMPVVYSFAKLLLYALRWVSLKVKIQRKVLSLAISDGVNFSHLDHLWYTGKWFIMDSCSTQRLLTAAALCCY